MKTKKAFSLMELLVVSAIITIGAGALFTRMDQTQENNKELEVEGRKLSAIISSQRNDALSGKATAGASSGCKYVIQTNTDLDGYYTDGCNPMGIFELPRGITFSAAKGVSFKAPMASLVDSAGNEIPSTGFPIEFTLIKGAQSYVVSVYDLGRITEEFGL